MRNGGGPLRRGKRGKRNQARDHRPPALFPCSTMSYPPRTMSAALPQLWPSHLRDDLGVQAGRIMKWGFATTPLICPGAYGSLPTLGSGERDKWSSYLVWPLSLAPLPDFLKTQTSSLNDQFPCPPPELTLQPQCARGAKHGGTGTTVSDATLRPGPMASRCSQPTGSGSGLRYTWAPTVNASKDLLRKVVLLCPLYS